jgi:hypothetical protein
VTWQAALRAHLQDVRRDHLDIKVALGRAGARIEKLKLADLLWPILRERCHRELEAGISETPVLRVAMDVRHLVDELTGIFFESLGRDCDG